MPKRDPKTLRRGQPWNSLLTPFEDEIRALRKSRKSYKEIADELRVRHGEAASFTPSAIWKFVRVRARRTPYALPEPSAAPVAVVPPRQAASGASVTPPAVSPLKAPVVASAAVSAPVRGRGMLPPQHSKHHDAAGRPVPPPPDPRQFESGNL